MLSYYLEDFALHFGKHADRRLENMYVSPNFPTKKACKQAILDGKQVSVFSPGPFPCPTNGKVTIEGPHYPKPHTWYGTAIVKDGKVIKVT